MAEDTNNAYAARDITTELFGAAPKGGRTKPQLSVLVTMTDHGDMMPKQVDALVRQTLDVRQFEVIAVNDAEIAANHEYLQSIDPDSAHRIALRVFELAGISRAKAANIAIAQSCAELLVFLASDYLAGPRLLEAHLSFHQAHPEPYMVGIGPGLFPEPIRADPFCRWLEDSGKQFSVAFTKKDLKLPPGYFFCANSSAKRAFILKAGLFDESFPYNTTDDFEIGIRLVQHGMHSVYLPDAVALHDHHVTFDERRKAINETGQSAAIVEAKHPLRIWRARDPILRNRIRSAYYRLKHRLFGHDTDREGYWDSELAAEFVSGYRQAKTNRSVWVKDRLNAGGSHVPSGNL